MKYQTQCNRILALLRRGKSITQVDAIAFNCYRLSARILELRKEYGDSAITTTLNKSGMAVYTWSGK